MTWRRPAISRSPVLDRFATAIDMFLDVRRATSAWTRGFSGEGPATIQRSVRLAALDLAGLAQQARKTR
jgi:hypothetical protein